jgi:hypothetical protein
MSKVPENIEERLANLEAEVALLKTKLQSDSKTPWWETITGTFANDPVYDEAMRLGREYRESLRFTQTTTVIIKGFW